MGASSIDIHIIVFVGVRLKTSAGRREGLMMAPLARRDGCWRQRRVERGGGEDVETW